MKSKIIFLLFTILFCQSVFAQTGDNHGLILRGTGYNGTVELHDDYARWYLQLEMEFVNTGDKPVIIINPFLHYSSWQNKVTFYENSWRSNYKDRIFSKYITDKNIRGERLKELTEGLDSERPPENYTNTIEPNNSLHFTDTLLIRQESFNRKVDDLKVEKTFWEGYAEGDDCAIICGISVNGYSTFKIEYKINLLQHQKNPDLLENLKNKWKTFGVFPVDTNGGFTIVSQPIENNLKYKVKDSRKDRKNKEIYKTLQ